MDLASGYSDSINFGNGYTPAANNAINNNNANYWANQNYVSDVGRYDPFAQSGGFGAQTDYYSGLGAAFGRAVGPQMADNIYGVPGDTWSRMSSSDRATFNGQMGGGGGGGGGGGSFPLVDPTPDVGAGSPGGTPFGGGYGIGQGAPVANANQPGSSGRNDLAALMWGGTNSNNGGGNTYGVDPGIWGSMSMGDRNTFNNQMAQSGAPAGVGGGGGGGGTSDAPPYQGNPFYPPAPMEGQQGIGMGGGFGAPGFGIGDTRYTGQPGFGLGIGGTGAPDGSNVGGIYGTQKGGNPFGGGTNFGYGGFSDMRAAMSPSDIQAFRGQVSPDEFNTFMAAK